MILDQVTKTWAVEALRGKTITLIDGFLAFRLTRNTGAAFSSFQGAGSLIGVLAIGVALWLVIMLRRNPRPAEAWALALVLGGAVGNLIDRFARGDGVLDGAVVDFIEWWWIPNFNVADAAITIGAALLVLSAYLYERS